MKKKRHKIFSKFRDLEHGVLVCTDVMARGIDIPEVNWVVQYDPPSSAEFFVHRCGRTARAGHVGKALLFLLPSEESYVDFIKINQKAPMEELEDVLGTLDVSTACVSRLRRLASKDRAIYEKGIRAFVSYIQSYVKHQCNVIFRIKDLDIGKLATGFGLLNLPKMHEFKGKTILNFDPADVDVDKIPYR